MTYNFIIRDVNNVLLSDECYIEGEPADSDVSIHFTFDPIVNPDILVKFRKYMPVNKEVQNMINTGRNRSLKDIFAILVKDDIENKIKYEIYNIRFGSLS